MYRFATKPTNCLGSTRDLTDSTGNTLLAWQHYDAFGQRTWQAGPDFPSEFLFAGDWGYQNEYNSPTEPGVGLQYLQNRYYDPAVGRFISPDPSGFEGGANLYGYVDNDPANAVDPDGLNPLAPVAVAGAQALHTGAVAVSGAAHATGHPIVAAGSAAVGAFVGSAHATAGAFLRLGQWLGLAPNPASCPRGRAALPAARPLPVLPGPGGTSGSQAANLVTAASGLTVGPAYGTMVHTSFEQLLKNLGPGNYSTEVAYKGGIEVRRGTPGSVRLDVVLGPKTAPWAVYDLKTGSASLTPAHIQRIRAYLPRASRNIPGVEVRP